MKTESTKQILTELTIHITKMNGDLEHIKEKVNANNAHLEKINGRLRTAENSITTIKTIGTTFTFIIGVVLAWLGVDR